MEVELQLQSFGGEGQARRFLIRPVVVQLNNDTTVAPYPPLQGEANFKLAYFHALKTSNSTENISDSNQH